jgi:hypothetical protein
MEWQRINRPTEALPPAAGQGNGAPPWLRGTVLAALTLVLWISLLSFPTFVAGDSLDQSWQQCLGYFLRHRLQAGIDYIFTYGPLGYFTTTAYDPDLFWPKFAWELSLNLLTALAVLEVARHLPHFALQLLFFGLTIAFLPYLPDAVQSFLILALSLIPFLWRRLPLAYLVPCTLVLVLLALIKATLLVLAVGTVTTYTLYFLLARRWRWALVPGALFALFLALTWSLLGQSLDHLPAYLIGAWHITAGYGEAMAYEAVSRHISLALEMLLLLSAAVLLQARLLRRSPPTLLATAYICGMVFVVWKHAFVRHDESHTPIFFAFTMLVPFVLHALYQTPDYRPAWGILLGGSLALGLCANEYWLGLPQTVLILSAPFLLRGVLFHRPDDRRKRYAVVVAAVLLALLIQWVEDGWSRLSGRYDRFRRNAAAALAPAAMRGELEAVRERRRENWSLPRTRATVGDAPIDLFCRSQGVLLLNDLNYHPRPVFQSYSVYTPYLADANARFYRGPAAPEFVLLRLEPVDRRLTPAEDGPALLEVLRRYHPVLTEKSFLLLRRAEMPPADRSRADEVVVERTVRIGEEVRLDDLPGTYQVVSLQFEHTAWGKAMLVLYKPPELYMEARQEGATGGSLFRLIPGMVGQEFLLNPLLEDGNDLLGLYRRAPGRRVTSLRVQPPDEDWASYRPEFRLTVRCLKDLPCREGGVPPDDLHAAGAAGPSPRSALVVAPLAAP